ncbi:hypothetical protein [Microbispora siamensis]|uniref:Ribbon-helix-helix protein, CopG family n=1 Tax=Microbispora siamensis TaxID=564413 RepID=A0ABQ4GGJ6_9ACTN|nr:hypothetical protein [Microbispora siamensis]GIH60544.1 hypothetical protein Msi02_13610 [Microbispora siamensis]
MMLRLDEAQSEALRRCAEKEGRSMQEVVAAAVKEYLLRAADEETEQLAIEAVRRWKPLLDRLAQDSADDAAPASCDRSGLGKAHEADEIADVLRGFTASS